MNSGKSMLLLAKAYNFEERGIPYRIYKSSLDVRDVGFIHSRPLGDKKCCTISPFESFFDKEDWYNSDVKWLLIDEAQFLTAEQVDELAEIVDDCGIDVICYGLRTDFQTHLFEGSKRLFEVADTFEEIKSQCEDGNKNIFNARIDQKGFLVTEGEQIQVGAEDCYKSVSRKGYYEMFRIKEGEDVRRKVMKEKGKIELFPMTDELREEVKKNALSFLDMFGNRINENRKK
jgi:thymidine kinase